jgi:uncharacterized protein YjbI with pentapeptide repeats
LPILSTPFAGSHRSTLIGPRKRVNANTYLASAHLRDAKLCGTNLNCADLRGANFKGADLKDTDLSGANLDGASGVSSQALEGTALSLKGAIMPNGERHD